MLYLNNLLSFSVVLLKKISLLVLINKIFQALLARMLCVLLFFPSQKMILSGLCPCRFDMIWNNDLFDHLCKAMANLWQFFFLVCSLFCSGYLTPDVEKH